MVPSEHHLSAEQGLPLRRAKERTAAPVTASLTLLRKNYSKYITITVSSF